MENTSCCNLNRDMLRKVTVKIGLERINTQKGVTRLVMSLEFARKQKFKLKKIERSIYVRNIDSFQQEGTN